MGKQKPILDNHFEDEQPVQQVTDQPTQAVDTSEPVGEVPSTPAIEDTIQVVKQEVKPVVLKGNKMADPNKVKLYRGDKLIASAISLTSAENLIKQDSSLRYE